MAKRNLSLLACLLLLAVAASAEERPRSITVGGQGSARAEPDLARLSMAVQKLDPLMPRAREEVLGVTRKFLALCQKLGIDPKKVRTSGLIVRAEYRWDGKTNQQVQIGYTVQRELQVEVADLQRLGELVEGAVDAGVNQISPPQLVSSRERELHREALSAAARDAEANARAVAESLGAKLGAVRELSAADLSVPPPIPMVRAMAVRDGAADSGADTYATGTLKFDAQVTATFDLLPK
jgi:hypothetical protein